MVASWYGSGLDGRCSRLVTRLPPACPALCCRMRHDAVKGRKLLQLVLGLLFLLDGPVCPAFQPLHALAFLLLVAFLVAQESFVAALPLCPLSVVEGEREVVRELPCQLLSGDR